VRVVRLTLKKVQLSALVCLDCDCKLLLIAESGTKMMSNILQIGKKMVTDLLLMRDLHCKKFSEKYCGRRKMNKNSNTILTLDIS
jgi:hypothetical protein